MNMNIYHMPWCAVWWYPSPKDWTLKITWRWPLSFDFGPLWVRIGRWR
jgi:hypothetical protein